jgi:AcrR family transcriptional regulator
MNMFTIEEHMCSTLGRRQQQKEDTRRIILDAAYALFAETGYDKTTMRALSARAGVGLGTIFKHFPDKPSLLVAAYLEDMGIVISRALATIPTRPVQEQLLHLTRSIYSFYAQDLSFSRALISESIFLGGEHGSALDEQLQLFLQTVAMKVAEAVERGELPQETDPALSAQAFGSFYFGALVMGLKTPDFDVEGQVQLVGAMLDTWFAGL